MSMPTPGTRSFCRRVRRSAVVTKLREATVEAMKTPAVREKLEAAGLKIATDDQTAPDYLGRFVQSETAKWAATIKASGISID